MFGALLKYGAPCERVYPADGESWMELAVRWDGQAIQPQCFCTARHGMSDAMIWSYPQLSAPMLASTYDCWCTVTGIHTEAILANGGKPTRTMATASNGPAPQRREILDHQCNYPARSKVHGVSQDLALEPEALTSEE